MLISSNIAFQIAFVKEQQKQADYSLPIFRISSLYVFSVLSQISLLFGSVSGCCNSHSSAMIPFFKSFVLFGVITLKLIFSLSPLFPGGWDIFFQFYRLWTGCKSLFVSSAALTRCRGDCKGFPDLEPFEVLRSCVARCCCV